MIRIIYGKVIPISRYFFVCFVSLCLGITPTDDKVLPREVTGYYLDFALPTILRGLRVMPRL